MASIFISYAREDTDAARDLAEAFKARGADVWWDRRLLSGERYIEAILRQIAHADHVLLLLSEHSASSTWVAFEVGATRARELSSGRDFLKVGHLDESAVPGFIGERQSTPLPWGDWDRRHQALMDLLPALGLPQHEDYKVPAGEPDTSLRIFRAGGQWMELVRSRKGLACVLVDSGEERARIQWQLSPEELEEPYVQVHRADPDRSWSIFDIGPKSGWRWSPQLFTRRDGPSPEEEFHTALRELIEWDG